MGDESYVTGIPVRITSATYVQLQQLAREQDTTFADVVGELILTGLECQQRERQPA